jgi:hypothetical protein
MPQAKRPAKGKRPNKAISVLGIAGVSWAASTGGSPAEMPAAFAAPTAGSVADTLWQDAAPFRVPTLHEEEISDVSLATFHLFDKDDLGSQGIQLAAFHGGGGCGCHGGGGCHGCGGGFRGCGGGFRGCGAGVRGCRGCGVGFRGCGFGGCGCGGCGWGWGWGGGCCLSWGGCALC